MPREEVVFVAASYRRLLEARALAERLRAAGIRVRARWLLHEPQAYLQHDQAMCEMALMDLEDMGGCTSVACMTGDGPRESRGGKHCEFGWFLGRGLGLWLLGPREHPYHWLPCVRQTKREEELIEGLRRA